MTATGSAFGMSSERAACSSRANDFLTSVARARQDFFNRFARACNARK